MEWKTQYKIGGVDFSETLEKVEWKKLQDLINKNISAGYNKIKESVPAQHNS
jgi:hypothetical protein